jgi:hypothetical protein
MRCLPWQHKWRGECGDYVCEPQYGNWHASVAQICVRCTKKRYLHRNLGLRGAEACVAWLWSKGFDARHEREKARS